MNGRDVGTSASSTRLGALLLATLLVILGVSIVAYASFQFAVRLYGVPAGPGEFGDVFGLANAAFSGLALLGVILALYFQRLEFGDQIRELRGQTNLLHKQNVNLAITSVLLEYRSIDMFSAVKHLWRFKHTAGDELVSEYETIRKREDERTADLPEDQRLVLRRCRFTIDVNWCHGSTNY